MDKDRTRGGEKKPSTRELGQLARKKFSDLSVRYPGRSVFPSAEIAMDCKGTPYTATDLCVAFLADNDPLRRMAGMINDRHEGFKAQNGDAIPLVTLEMLRAAGKAFFDLAQTMSILTKAELTEIIDTFDPSAREASELSAKAKLVLMGVEED